MTRIAFDREALGPKIVYPPGVTTVITIGDSRVVVCGTMEPEAALAFINGALGGDVRPFAIKKDGNVSRITPCKQVAGNMHVLLERRGGMR